MTHWHKFTTFYRPDLPLAALAHHLLAPARPDPDPGRDPDRDRDLDPHQRWCGGSRATERCLTGSCGWLVPERREKEQLFQVATRPFGDLSLEKDPRCSACHTGGDAVRYRVRKAVFESGSGLRNGLYKW